MAKEIGRMTISFLDDNTISVQGFPSKFENAVQAMQAATVVVIDHFFKAATEGRTKDGVIFKKADDATEECQEKNPMIYTSDKPLIIPVGLVNGKMRKN
ncbi:MAG: hypothetical protein ACLQBD_18350 [Syntrophobacteraceae bacterium]